MKITFKNKFWRSFGKLHPNLKEMAFEALSKLRIDPRDPSLRNHKLRGILEGMNAISVNDSVRIIFEEEVGQITIISIGTHDEVY